MKKRLTARGFPIIEFKDMYDQDCSLQVSSSIEPAVWFGIDNGNSRMHLDKRCIRKLMAILKDFLVSEELNIKPIKILKEDKKKPGPKPKLRRIINQ